MEFDRVVYDRLWELAPVQAGALTRDSLFNTRGNIPCAYSVFGDVRIGKSAIRIYPEPRQSKIVTTLYNSRIAVPTVEETKDGKVSIPAGTNLLTGSGTAFTQKHVGCVIRLSLDPAKQPTYLDGDNPADDELLIVEVPDPTHAVLSDNAANNYSNARYSVSGLINIDADVMQQLFLRTAEKHLSGHRTFNKDRLPAINQRYRDALVLARETDKNYVPRQWSGMWPTGAAYVSQSPMVNAP
jgi:hypothetical protein